MRTYLAATLNDLPDLAAGVELMASAPTSALAAALPEEDTEGLEMSAFLTAADLSVLRIAERGAPARRVVLSVDVAAHHTTELPADLPDPLRGLPSLVGLVRAQLADVVAVHVDDDAAVDLVRAAAAGDQAAFDELVEEDLLWYDPSELRDLLP